MTRTGFTVPGVTFGDFDRFERNGLKFPTGLALLDLEEGGTTPDCELRCGAFSVAPFVWLLLRLGDFFVVFDVGGGFTSTTDFLCVSGACCVFATSTDVL